jgi:calcium permeable stress-gated cation channel
VNTLGWICYNIKYEMRHFIQSRQHHLIGKAHSDSAQSRTLLITGIPSRYLTERQLFSVFSYLPGGVAKVWLNRDLQNLPDVYKARNKAISKLELAITQLLATATKMYINQDIAEAKARLKANKTEGNAEKTKRGPSTESTVPLTPVQGNDLERAVSRAEALVPKEKRPRHRTKTASWLPFAIPFTGQVVDSIDWARSEIIRCNEILAAGRVQWREDMATDDDSADDFYKPLNSAFILFNQQIAVHLALQSVIHHEAYRMAGKHIEISQEGENICHCV